MNYFLSPWALLPKAQAINNTLVLAALVGCNQVGPSVAAQVACLRAVPPSTLSYVQFASQVDSAGLGVPFPPIMDGSFIPFSNSSSDLLPLPQNKPVLLGVNRNEGIYFLLYLVPRFLNNLFASNAFDLTDNELKAISQL